MSKKQNNHKRKNKFYSKPDFPEFADVPDPFVEESESGESSPGFPENTGRGLEESFEESDWKEDFDKSDAGTPEIPESEEDSESKTSWSEKISAFAKSAFSRSSVKKYSAVSNPKTTENSQNDGEIFQESDVQTSSGEEFSEPSTAFSFSPHLFLETIWIALKFCGAKIVGILSGAAALVHRYAFRPFFELNHWISRTIGADPPKNENETESVKRIESEPRISTSNSPLSAEKTEKDTTERFLPEEIPTESFPETLRVEFKNEELASEQECGQEQEEEGEYDDSEYDESEFESALFAARVKIFAVAALVLVLAGGFGIRYYSRIRNAEPDAVAQVPEEEKNMIREDEIPIEITPGAKEESPEKTGIKASAAENMRSRIFADSSPSSLSKTDAISTQNITRKSQNSEVRTPVSSASVATVFEPDPPNTAPPEITKNPLENLATIPPVLQSSPQQDPIDDFSMNEPDIFSEVSLEELQAVDLDGDWNAPLDPTISSPATAISTAQISSPEPYPEEKIQGTFQGSTITLPKDALGSFGRSASNPRPASRSDSNPKYGNQVKIDAEFETVAENHPRFSDPAPRYQGRDSNVKGFMNAGRSRKNSMLFSSSITDTILSDLPERAGNPGTSQENGRTRTMGSPAGRSIFGNGGREPAAREIRPFRREYAKSRNSTEVSTEANSPFEPLASIPNAVENTKYRSYEVQEGDHFFNIAKKELGDVSRWREIQQLNKGNLGENPGYLEPGTQIQLPQ